MSDGSMFLSTETHDTRVIALVGPTAAGKTAVAERLAAGMDGEIVSADSMQVYRGMNIGTAKPSVAERTVPYHCLDLVDPGDEYSAALFQRDARDAIADISRRAHLPFVVGGTGLYVRAALDDLRFPSGELENPERRRLERLADEIGAHALHDRLAKADPASAALIHPNNVRRTIRALEIAHGGGSYAEQASGFSTRASIYTTTWMGLHVERATLYERIEQRVDAMIGSGLLDEVRGLLAQGFREALTATQAIGYKELVPVLEDGADLGSAIAQIKQASRRYAKRQLTWFRADSRVVWVDVTELSTDQAVRRIAELLESGTAP